MPATITPERKKELLERLELARQAKAAKQAQKPASTKSASAKKSATSAETSKPSQLTPPPPPTPTVPEVSTSQTPPLLVSEPATSSLTTNAPENASLATATEISLPSTQAETPSKPTRGRKKVCLPDSETDSDEEDEKPKKKRSRKPYATIVLHREPKKSIDKVIERLAHVESSSSESEDEEPVPTPPVPIPQPKKNTRPVVPQTQSPHNQDQQRREMLRRLALEYWNA